MKTFERVMIGLIGIAAAVVPVILRLSVFKADTEYIDGEFWGVIVAAGFFFGMICLWSAISGERAFDELGVSDDSKG